MFDKNHLRKNQKATNPVLSTFKKSASGLNYFQVAFARSSASSFQIPTESFDKASRCQIQVLKAQTLSYYKTNPNQLIIFCHKLTSGTIRSFAKERLRLTKTPMRNHLIDKLSRNIAMSKRLVRLTGQQQNYILMQPRERARTSR